MFCAMANRLFKNSSIDTLQNVIAVRAFYSPCIINQPASKSYYF